MLKILLLLFYFVGAYANCQCAKSEIPYNVYDISTNLNYSSEWWYFLLNTEDIRSPIISTEIIILRYGNTCNKTSLFIYQHSDLLQNGSFIKKHEATIHDSVSGENHVQINNYNITWNRDEKYHIQIQGTHKISVTGYGYPQGLSKNGFVKTGNQTCDSSYTLSFMDLRGTYNNYYVRGYGEHVLTSSNSQNSPYLGWNCHYFHAIQNSSVSDYFLCQSKFRNSKISDPYQRAMLLYNNNTIWTCNFTAQSLNSWKSPLSNSTYSTFWLINIPELEIQHYFIPLQNQQEVISQKNMHFWDGSAIVFNTHGNIIGYGFNEIFKLLG